MGVLAAVERTAQSYPAALPFVALGLITGTIWAYRRKRLWLMAAMALLAAVSALLYTNGFPAQAASPPGTLAAGSVAGLAPGPPLVASPAGGTGPPPRRASYDLTYFSSTTRLHPRFPSDLSLPSTFILEHSSGGVRQGAITVRFRFRGEGADAAKDLRELGRQNGWAVEVLAPHRMIFRKGDQLVNAWLSYPGHSLVLDIPDPR